MAINAPWHRRHRMPGRATLEQRIAWHLEQQRHCACRPIPEELQRAIARTGSPSRTRMLPRLKLDARERAQALRIAQRYLKDESRIVKTCSMQALAEFAIRNPRLRPRILRILQTATATGSPAMRSRGRRLLATLNRQRRSRARGAQLTRPHA